MDWGTHLGQINTTREIILYLGIFCNQSNLFIINKKYSDTGQLCSLHYRFTFRIPFSSLNTFYLHDLPRIGTFSSALGQCRLSREFTFSRPAATIDYHRLDLHCIQ